MSYDVKQGSNSMSILLNSKDHPALWLHSRLQVFYSAVQTARSDSNDNLYVASSIQSCYTCFSNLQSLKFKFNDIDSLDIIS